MGPGARWLDELEERARDVLPAPVFEYVVQGARDGITAGEATAAWRAVRLRPRVLHDVTHVDTSVELLGRTYRVPWGVAPSTLQRAIHPDGELAMARACADAGSLMVVSSNAGTSFAEIGATGVDWWLQAYLPARLSAEEIAREWAVMTFGDDEQVIETVCRMLLGSWETYERYTAPLGVGWMVNPNHHYGPNVDGYEYSKWGTYHFADCRGIGVDRTMAAGTGYTGQYHSPQAERFESVETCPDELLLFFHHVPYTHRLNSGKTVIQHIYDTHFEGAEQAGALVSDWMALEGKVDGEVYRHTLERLREQAEHAKEWRDVINTYFLRKSGIPDAHNRTIY